MPILAEPSMVDKNIDKKVDKKRNELVDKPLETINIDKQALKNFHQEGMQSLEHLKRTGLHVTHQEVSAWMNSLSTNNPLPRPQVHL